MSAASLERAASVAPERRVLALVLPELLCELAEKRLLLGLQRSKVKPPLGVVLVANAEVKTEPSSAAELKPIDATTKLSAVNESAKRYGVREGQTIAEACALVANLVRVSGKLLAYPERKAGQRLHLHKAANEIGGRPEIPGQLTLPHAYLFFEKTIKLRQGYVSELADFHERCIAYGCHSPKLYVDCLCISQRCLLL